MPETPPGEIELPETGIFKIAAMPNSLHFYLKTKLAELALLLREYEESGEAEDEKYELIEQMLEEILRRPRLVDDEAEDSDEDADPEKVTSIAKNRLEISQDALDAVRFDDATEEASNKFLELEESGEVIQEEIQEAIEIGMDYLITGLPHYRGDKWVQDAENFYSLLRFLELLLGLREPENKLESLFVACGRYAIEKTRDDFNSLYSRMQNIAEHEKFGCVSEAELSVLREGLAEEEE